MLCVPSLLSHRCCGCIALQSRKSTPPFSSSCNTQCAVENGDLLSQDFVHYSQKVWEYHTVWMWKTTEKVVLVSIGKQGNKNKLQKHKKTLRGINNQVESFKKLFCSGYILFHDLGGWVYYHFKVIFFKPEIKKAVIITCYCTERSLTSPSGATCCRFFL